MDCNILFTYVGPNVVKRITSPEKDLSIFYYVEKV